MNGFITRALRMACGAALLASLLAAAHAALPAAQEPAAKRRPIPDKTAQAAALKLVLEIFADDIENAKEPAAKTTLANQLLVILESHQRPQWRFRKPALLLQVLNLFRGSRLLRLVVACGTP